MIYSIQTWQKQQFFSFILLENTTPFVFIRQMFYCKQLIELYIPPPQTRIWVEKFPCILINILSYCKVKKVKHSFIGGIIDENLLCISKFCLHFVSTHTRTMYTTHFIINLYPSKQDMNRHLPNSSVGTINIFISHNYHDEVNPTPYCTGLIHVKLVSLPVNLLKANLLKSIIN